MTWSVDAALTLFCWGFGLAALVTTLEFWSIRGSLRPGGLWDWEVLQTRTRFALRVARWLAALRLTDRHLWTTLCLVRLVAALVVLPLHPLAWLTGIGLLIIGATTVVILFRLMFGLDGSDQLLALLSLGGGAALLAGDQASREYFCWFASAILAISYGTAGLTKLASPVWRSGRALGVIMRTEVYGDRRFIEIAEHRVGRVLTRVVGPLEVAFPLAVIAWPYGAPILAMLAAFHVSTALLMGLNGFVLAYLAPYGCVVWCALQVVAARS